MKKVCSRCQKWKEIPDDKEICRACQLKNDLQRWTEQRRQDQIGTEQSAHAGGQAVVSVPPTLTIADPASVNDLREWIEQRRQNQIGTEQSAQAAQQGVASIPPVSGSAGFTSAQVVSSATSSSLPAGSSTASGPGSFTISRDGTTGSASHSGPLAVIKGPVVHALVGHAAIE